MIEISEDEMKAVLAPELGGVVMSLSFGGKNIFRPAASQETVAADPREAACYPCVPWFSRLFDGLDFDGRHYDLAPTLPACDPDHALHGHGWVNPWRVTDQSGDHVACRFDHTPGAGLFPFPFFATQEISVSTAMFKIALCVTNSGNTPMPAGLGIHPFFPNTKASELNFTEYFDQTKPASGLTPPAKIEHRGPMTDDPVDYTIRRWDGTADIVHDGLKIAMHSNARILHLYSPEEADFYCAEPISHLPGYFGRDILAPQETMDIFLSLCVENLTC